MLLSKCCIKIYRPNSIRSKFVSIFDWWWPMVIGFYVGIFSCIKLCSFILLLSKRIHFFFIFFYFIEMHILFISFNCKKNIKKPVEIAIILQLNWLSIYRSCKTKQQTFCFWKIILR